MININDFHPKLLLINEFTMLENGPVRFGVNYFKVNNTPHVVFNNIECIF